MPKIKPQVSNIEKLGRVQDLIGRAKGDYWNDRSDARASKVVAALEEAFDLVVEIRSSIKSKRSVRCPSL